jgi:hypothetical protein
MITKLEGSKAANEHHLKMHERIDSLNTNVNVEKKRDERY